VQPKSRPRAVTAKAQPGYADQVPEKFTGRKGVLLATGPSLSRDDVEYLRPLHKAGDVVVFGLNDAYRWCDFLDVFYFCDPRWLDANLDALDYVCDEVWTQDAGTRAKYPNKIKRVAGTSGNGICKQPSHIFFGGNSGFQCLNLAFHFGIREFYLLGYNMDVPPGKKQHMFGPHPQGLNQAHNYKGFIGSFNQINKDDRAMITNCTYPTALDCFRKLPLKEALPHDQTRHVRIEEPAPEIRRTIRPSQKAAKKPAIPVSGRRTNMGGDDGGLDRDRAKPVTRPTGFGTLCAYGGQV